MNVYEHYENKIREIRNQPRRRPLKQQEAKQIALDLGLTETEWLEWQKNAAAHLKRGQGFLKHGNWTEAATELNQADVLNPDHRDTLFHLARAHWGRWLEDHDQGDRQKALELARRCLEIDPAHDPSLILVGEIKIEAGKWRHKKWGLAAFGVAAVVVAAAVALFLTAPREPVPPIQAESPTQTTSMPPPVQPSVNNPPNAPPTPVPPALGLPVRFMANDKSQGLEFKPEASDYKKYQDAYAYELRGEMMVGEVEVEQLKLKIELKDEAGVTVITGYKEVLAQYQPLARPRDIIACSYHYFAKSKEFPQLKEALVSVESIARRPGAPSYDPSPRIDFTWSSQPLNVDLEIRERFTSVTQGYILNPEDAYFKLVLEVENTGNTTLKTLTLAIKCFDQNNQLMAENKTYVTMRSEPRLKPRQTRVHSTTLALKNMKAADFKQYTVTVMDAD